MIIIMNSKNKKKKIKNWPEFWMFGKSVKFNKKSVNDCKDGERWEIVCINVINLLIYFFLQLIIMFNIYIVIVDMNNAR